MTNTYIATNDENATQVKLEASSKKWPNYVEIMAPILTVSEANGGAKRAIKRNGKTVYKSEHWTEKHTRHKRQKGTVALLLRPVSAELRMPCHITLTRYAPRKLDKFDNLPMSLKYILDMICEIITNDNTPGRADSHEGLSVTYEQVTSKEYWVRIIIKNI